MSDKQENGSYNDDEVRINFMVLKSTSDFI